MKEITIAELAKMPAGTLFCLPAEEANGVEPIKMLKSAAYIGDTVPIYELCFSYYGAVPKSDVREKHAGRTVPAVNASGTMTSPGTAPVYQLTRDDVHCMLSRFLAHTPIAYDIEADLMRPKRDANLPQNVLADGYDAYLLLVDCDAIYQRQSINYDKMLVSAVYFILKQWRQRYPGAGIATWGRYHEDAREGEYCGTPVLAFATEVTPATADAMPSLPEYVQAPVLRGMIVEWICTKVVREWGRTPHCGNAIVLRLYFTPDKGLMRIRPVIAPFTRQSGISAIDI